MFVTFARLAVCIDPDRPWMNMKNSIKIATFALVITLGLTVSHAAKADTVSDPDLIRQAQDILYKLNYDVGEINGQMTEETREAIRSYQRNKNLSDDGILTVNLLLELRDARIPSTWGAISAAVDGAWGATWNYNDRLTAEREAKQECAKNTEHPCDVVAVHGDNCLALYHWNGKERWGWAIRTGASIDKAKLESLQHCRSNRTENVPCDLRTVACANGRHKTN